MYNLNMSMNIVQVGG